MQRHGIKAIMTNKPSVYNGSSHASRHNITWHYPPKSLSNLPAPSSLGGSREMGGGEDGRGKGGGEVNENKSCTSLQQTQTIHDNSGYLVYSFSYGNPLIIVITPTPNKRRKNIKKKLTESSPPPLCPSITKVSSGI